MKRSGVLLLIALLAGTFVFAAEEVEEEQRGWLGVYTEGLSEAVLIALNIEHGALVGGVVEGSPAEEAGLQKGDVILQIDGQKIEDASGLREVVRERPEAKVSVSLRRRGKGAKKTVTLGKRDKTHPAWIGESGLMEIPEDALRITRKVLRGVPGGDRTMHIEVLGDELEEGIEELRADLEEELEELKEELEELRKELEQRVKSKD